MDPEDLNFSGDGMLDYDGTGGFDAGDMSAFTEDTVFASQFNTDFSPSPYNTGLTPVWPSLDTPGKYPRNDSSVTAIMAANNAHQEVKPRSHQSSTSPDSSSQDSPASSQSSTRRKRKSPTSQDTATSATTKATAPSQRDGPPSLSPTYDPKKQAALRGKQHVMHAPSVKPAAQTPDMVYHEQSVDNISSAMNHSNLFDFDSAASSPGAFGNGMSATAFDALNTTPRTTGLMQDTPKLAAADPTNPKAAKFFFESRENSPMTAMSASHHASPVAMFSTDSPQTTHSMAGDGTFWPAQARAPHFDFNNSTLMTPSPIAENMSVGMSSPLTTVTANANLGQLPCQLSIKPFNNKSRVETQIPVVLTISPMPANVSRVHLQSHTISKPKLLAKEPQKSADSLELHAAVVCTSAMQKPHLKERALKRAAGIAETPVKREVRRSSTGDVEDENTDPNDPLNGGDVKICSNCVNRERKRAARKKAKKQEDEDHWSQFEQERIVVFNTSEYKDWQPVAKDGGQADSQHSSEGAMYVEVPMRIACYCRHQSEKIGFQVIFTIKDWQDRVLAQNISDSILITDDHKTQPTVAGTGGLPSGEFNFSGAVSGYNSPELPSASFQQHRPYHSTNDLQALRSQFPQQAFHGMQSHNDPSMMMQQQQQQQQQPSSAAVTPRNLSRPASPTFQGGSSKRRKGSSVHVQIPANLRMTQRTQNTGISVSMGGMGAAPMSAGPIMGSADPSFAMTPMSAPTYQSQPPTPNSNTGFVNAPINRTSSNDNMQMYQFYSTPHSQNPSRGPSRVPSPVMSRPTSRTIPPHQAPQMQTPMGGQGMHGMSFSPEAQQPQRPTLTRLNPREGPLSGNIQVDIHGTGFRPGIQVYFGDKMAQFNIWNEGALIAVVPPGNVAGPVEVKIQDPSDNTGLYYRRDPLYFTYNDDREPAIWELFGRTMFEKQFGHTDVNQARAMLSPTNGMSYGYGGSSMQMNYSQMQQMQQQQAQTVAAARACGNTEDALLQLLNVIDLDDSPFAANFDMRLRNTGTTIVALASGLGYTRLVAALVARGATVDTRDRCGFTPLMLASMRGHRHIVRLLVRRGADPTVRNRVGFTAADLASSSDIAFELEQTAQHVRQRSVGGTPALGSRANSVAFADNPYMPPTPARSSDASLVTVSDDSEAVEDIDELPTRLDAGGFASRRSSMAQPTSRRSSRRPSGNIELPLQLSNEQAAMMMPPMASMTAWHSQLLAQMNRLQQSVSDIQFAMPNIQDSVMVRRFSSIMPFSASTPPPPYEEKDPARLEQTSTDEKASVATAAAEAALDDACERRFGSPGTATTTATATACARSRTVERGQIIVDRDIQVSIGKTAISREQQEQLRLAHQARLKSGRSDWKVWVIWLPLLVVVALLTARNMLSQPSVLPAHGRSSSVVA